MNTFQNGTFNVIHSSTQVDFTNNVYAAVYCSATSSILVNGTTIACSIGETIPIIVKSAGTTLSVDFLLLGNVKPILHPTGKLGTGDTYTYVDIRTGNQITS